MIISFMCGPFQVCGGGCVRVQLLLYVSIRGSVASVNWFSSHVVRYLLLCSSVSFGHALAFTLTCQPNPVLVENADAC